MSDNTPLLQYTQAHKADFLADLLNILRIPSISTDPECVPDMRKAADWLADQLRAMHFDKVQIFQTARHPVVYGEFLSDPKAPTVLVYGHYDVQPAEPLEPWNTAPFEPSVRMDNLYARGSSDMKGQILAAFKAVETLQQNNALKINIKFMLEGEEEIGSPNLDAFMTEHKDLLSCDFVLNPDAGMVSPGVPTLVYALRGLAYFELRVYGPATDLHSGIFGGVVHNPAQALCEIIAGMHDAEGHITLPGFYDSVQSLTPEERKELARLPMDDAFYLEKSGVPALWGEQSFTPSERTGARPTLEIHGLNSGFTSKGSKTVIPSWAMAKLSCRLVANQDPEQVHQQLRAYLQANVPASVRWELDFMPGSGPACTTNPNTPAARHLADAMEMVWGVRPVFKREGGSIPVVASMQKILGVESVLTGFGLPDDSAHGPNEKLHLPTWYLGIDALVIFLNNLAEGL